MKPCELLAKYRGDRGYRLAAGAVGGLIFNLIFACYNGILGVMTFSPIFIVSAIYYLLLGVMRLLAVITYRRQDERREKGSRGFIGAMLIILGAVFALTVTVSMSENTARGYGEITMITIATFTFTKITAAVINALHNRGERSRTLKAISAIRYCEVGVSLLTMQQSMLLSFGEMPQMEIVIFNAATGAGVCAMIIFLGIYTLVYGRGGEK